MAGRLGAGLGPRPVVEAAALVVGAAVAALSGGVGRAVGGAGLVVAVVRLLPAHGVFAGLERRRALTVALAGSTTVVLAGVASLALAPLRVLSVGFGLVAADLVMVALAGGPRRRAEPSASDLEASGHARGAVASAVAFGGTVGVHLLVLANAVGSDDAQLLGALAVAGLLPLVVTGTLPALFVRGLSEGRREAIVPALLLGAGFGSLAALVVTAAPRGLLGISDERLVDHAPHVVSAAVLLGLAQLLVHPWSPPAGC